MKSKYSLDTHALVWYSTGDSRLSSNAKLVIDAIFSSKYVCFLSTIVLLEAFYVSLRKKTYSFPDLLKQLGQQNIIIVPLDKVVLSACYHIQSSFDIHDRIIVSTAKVSNSILITRDREIRKSKVIETLW
ncbi:PIN domain-containing protein [Candidatus Gottesmanbacteria bacterium]|nr:PIN domain-containing protein [Candidatus Gottesmanbacteria bacterium]